MLDNPVLVAKDVAKQGKQMIKGNLKKDNYLSYITPLKSKNSKHFSKVINILDKK